MRIAVAEIVQETGSFSQTVAEIQDFENYGLFFGQDVLDRLPSVGPIGGLLEVAHERGEVATFIPIIRAWGGAGGIISADVFNFLKRHLIEGIASAQPLDGIFLSLHGAAASEVDDDVEGQLLEAIRQIVGPDLPIAVCLDHHANITQKMVDHATLLVGHETQPHDPKSTGRKTANLFFRVLHGEIIPRKAWRKIPMITPQDQFLTSQGPMKAWFDLAREMEHRDGVIDVSPYPMQPWLDVKEGGWAVVVHTNNQSDLADQLAAESARFAWDRRQDFWLSERVDSELAVQQADQADRGLIILSDTGDSVYGGAPGDSTCILRALVAHPPTGIALIPLIEPKAVQAAHSAGVGSQISQTFHESNAVVSSTLLSSRKIESSFQLNCRVAAISKGVTIQLPERGVCEIGRTALLEIGQIRLVVMELRSFAINHPVLYTHLGLDIGDAKMVVLKTASNFQFFAQWRSGLIRVDTPGATQSDLTAFNWSHLPRPIFPFDPSCEFLG